MQANKIKENPGYNTNSKSPMHAQPRAREVHGMMGGLLEAEGLCTPLNWKLSLSWFEANAACSTGKLYSGTPGMLLALISHNWITDILFYRWVKI